MPLPSKALTTFIANDNTVCFNNNIHHKCYPSDFSGLPAPIPE